MVTPEKTAIITEPSGGVGASKRVPTKEDFDWLCCEMTGFMRTQILADGSLNDEHGSLDKNGGSFRE
jgi:hypothetical protein